MRGSKALSNFITTTSAICLIFGYGYRITHSDSIEEVVKKTMTKYEQQECKLQHVEEDTGLDGNLQENKKDTLFIDMANTKSNHTLMERMMEETLLYSGMRVDKKHILKDGSNLYKNTVVVTDKEDIAPYESLFDTKEVIGSSYVFLVCSDGLGLTSGGTGVAKDFCKTYGESKELTFKALDNYIKNIPMSDRKINIYVPAENSNYRDEVRLYLANNYYTLLNSSYAYNLEDINESTYLDLADKFMESSLQIRDSELASRLGSEESGIFILPERAVTEIDESAIYSQYDGLHVENTVRRNLYLMYNIDSIDNMADKVKNRILHRKLGYRQPDGSVSQYNYLISKSDNPKQCTVIINEVEQ